MALFMGARFGCQCWRLVAALSLLLGMGLGNQVIAQPQQASAENDTLVVGVSPWTHQSLLFKWTKPIVSKVQAHTEQKVVIGSAKDLFSYFKRAQQGAFDVFLSPINFGLHLIREEGFVPLLWARVGYSPMIVCNKQASINTLEDLNGKALIFPPRVAVTSMVIKYDLDQAGVRYSPVHFKDQWVVIEHLLGGKQACAVVLSNLYDAKSDKFKERFAVLYRNELALDALLIAPAEIDKNKYAAVMKLVDHFDVPDSIVRRFDPVTTEELDQVSLRLAPVLEAFKGLVNPVTAIPIHQKKTPIE